MARFPRNELGLSRLALDVSKGLDKHPDAFPKPPMTAHGIVKAVEAFENARQVAMDAAAQARKSTAAKKKARASLEESVKATIRYAESISRGREKTLRLLGWGPRRAKVYLTPPGQAVNLRVVDQTPTKITLAWRKPFDGGRVRMYRVERRDPRRGPWIHATESLQPKVTIKREAGLDCQYRVIAANKKGEGMGSNEVRVMH